MSILTVRDLKKAFGAQSVLHDVSAAVESGQRIGVVGPNGCGKTTLLKLIAGEIEIDSGQINLQRGAIVSYVSQQPRLDPAQTLSQQIKAALDHVHQIEHEMQTVAESLSAHPDGPEHDAAMKRFDHLQHLFEHAGGWEIDRRVDAVIEELGFRPTDMGTPVGQLSGGQKSRVQLARMLLEAADLIILDEPTNHLDMNMLGWLEEKLIEFSEAAMLIVSHDRYFLDRVSTHIWDMTGGTLGVYNGNYSAYVEQRELRRLTQERQWQQQAKFIEKQEEYIRRFQAGQRSKQARGRKTRLERYKAEDAVARPTGPGDEVILNLKVDKPSGREVLKVKGLSHGFSDQPLFNNVEFELPRGRRVGIVGPNGCGKSTLLNILAGLTTPRHGAVTWGHGVSIQYYRQEQQDLDLTHTIYEELQATRIRANRQQIYDLAAMFLFSGDMVDKPISGLSGGEKARVCMAKMLLNPANVILMDEPTNHLDLMTCEVVEDALQTYDGTLLIVSHDRCFLDSTCDMILAIEPWDTAGPGWRLVEESCSDYLASMQARMHAIAEKQRKAEQAAVKTRPTASAKPASARPQSKIPHHLRQLSVHQLEEEIARLEKAIADTAAAMADPAVARDQKKLATFNSDYEKFKAELSLCSQAWEEKMASA
ncbi:MAG: ABC-F family ATP-binding cassette domain-containing protein [Phycisphaerae bacterium]